MSKTRIFVTTDAAEADQTYGAWNATAGWTAVKAGPTDKIEAKPCATDELLWSPDGAGPWYTVVAWPG
jgi:hypothetical protein